MEVAASVQSALRPQFEPQMGWSNDSDHNTSYWQTLAASLYLADGFRGFASAGVTEFSDPVRTATRGSPGKRA